MKNRYAGISPDRNLSNEYGNNVRVAVPVGISFSSHIPTTLSGESQTSPDLLQAKKVHIGMALKKQLQRISRILRDGRERPFCPRQDDAVLGSIGDDRRRVLRLSTRDQKCTNDIQNGDSV